MKIKLLYITIVLMVFCGSSYGQGILSSPIFSEDFGTLANNTAITTGNTNFSYVRIGTSGTGSSYVNQIIAKNPSSFTASSGLMSAKGGSISTVDKTGLTSFSSGTFTFKFKTPSSLTSAVMFSAIGTGATFGSASGFTGNQLSSAFQVNGANLQIRANGSWTTVQSVAVSTSYTITIVFNNTAGSLNYGDGNTLTSNKCHLWLDGTYIGEYATATSGLAASAFRIYTTTSAFEVDDIAVYNILPAPTGPYSIKSGDWNDISTWSTNTVPLSSENATISTGHTVYTNTSLARDKITKVNGTFELRDLGYASGTGTFIYNNTTGTLNFNLSTGSYAVNNADVYWPTTNGPYNVNVLNAGMNLTAGANRTVNGTFTTANAGASSVSFPSATLTLNGTCIINPGGAFGSSPIFGNASTIQYYSTGIYGRGLEWSYNGVGTVGTTAGYPNNVQISNNTTLNYPNGTVLNKAIAGNLTIDSGSSFYMDYGSITAGGFLTVAGNLTNNGNFTLGFAVGDDLKLGGNFINTGIFNGNNRAIFFTKTGTQTVSSTTALTIPYVVFQPVSGSTTVQLLSNLIISAPLAGNAIAFSNASDIFDLNSKSLTIGTTGVANVISGDGTFKGHLSSNLTLLGLGSIGTLRFTSGLQILNNLTLNRQTGIIGFDLGSGITINGTLALTNGIANLDNNTMIITLGGSITGASSSNYIIADLTSGGILRKNLSTTGSFTFPIGDSVVSANGSQYSPITINFTSASFSGGYAAFSVEDNIEPNCITATDYISRYWNLICSGITNATYNIIGTYLPADIVGVETKSIATRYSSSNSSWTDGTNLVSGANTVALTGLTSATGALDSPNHFTAAYREQEIRVERSTGTLIPTASVASTGYDTDFGTQTLFTTTATKTYTIRNIGNANLIISNPTLIGTNTGDFIITAATTLTINGATTATFTVAFSPTAIGTRTATVQIVNNDSDENPYTFDVTGIGDCPSSTNTITPTSGPVGTIVTITSSDITTNNLTGATAFFNGVVAAVTQISASQISVIVPSGAVSGNLYVTNTFGCIVSNAFTVIDNKGNSCQGGNFASDLFISEVTDATTGGLTYVEIYNGTNSAINVNGYSLKTYSNGDMSSPITLPLNNFLLNPGSIYLVAIGAASTPDATNTCSITGGNGSLANQITTNSGINFDVAGNDYIGLYKNSTSSLIDSFGTFGVNNWADFLGLGDRGVDFRRKNNVTVPKFAFSTSDWDIIDWLGKTQASCYTNDYSDIGVYNFLSGTPPTVDLHPSYTPTCKVTSLTVAGTEGYNGSSPADTKELYYQWYVNIPPATGWTPLSDDLIYSGSNEVELTISDISGLINNQYYCQIQEDTNTCYSATNAIQITDGGVAIWKGTVLGWTNGPPTLDKLVIIDADYNTITEGSFDACSLVVNATKTLTVSSNDYANIRNDLTVNGVLIVEDSGSIVQIDDNGINTGNISVTRIAQARHFDYVYWGSPVGDFAVKSLPNTLHYEWNTTILNPKLTQGNWVAPTTVNMTKGQGYIARASNGATVAQDLPVNFIGTPFNGKFNFPIARGSNTSLLDDNWNLLGNPYASAIDVKKFLFENADPTGPNPVLEGAVHIWSHGTLPAKIGSPFYQDFTYNYTAGDFIVYNATGPVSGPNTFLGKIASGQGFFVRMIDGPEDFSQAIIFKNSMRDVTYKNDNFYKNNQKSNEERDLEVNRIWLDLFKKEGGNSRTLVGYINGATYDKDVMYDAILEPSEMCIYSLVGDKNVIIQGRPLPFESSDRVFLGVNILKKDAYVIAIGAVDGLFLGSSQNIYIEDTELNIIHDLKQSPYEFTIEKGKFDARFILRYNRTSLSTTTVESIDSDVIVVPGESEIKIKSFRESIKNVTIYDILGRQILEKTKVNTKEITIPNIILSTQVLLLKIDLENGQRITKKIIF